MDKENLAVEEKMLGMGWIFEKSELADTLLGAKDCLQYLYHRIPRYARSVTAVYYGIRSVRYPRL